MPCHRPGHHDGHGQVARPPSRRVIETVTVTVSITSPFCNDQFSSRKKLTQAHIVVVTPLYFRWLDRYAIVFLMFRVVALLYFFVGVATLIP